MVAILVFLGLASLALTAVLLVIMLRRTLQADFAMLISRLETFEKVEERTERAVREEAAQSREEFGKEAREQRQEITVAFKSFGDSVVQRMMDVAGLQKEQFDAFSGQLGSFAKASGERLDAARAESALGGKQLREEVVATLKTLSGAVGQTMTELANAQRTQFEAFSNQLGSFAKASGERLDSVRSESAAGAKQLREEIVTTLNAITEGTTKAMGEMANIQKSQLDTMSLAITRLSDSNEKKLEAIRETIGAKLQDMQIENTRQLDQMRQTVDEKLQGTLEKRLGESFKQVSERLELVHKGLGEMQTLATGVGDLKKVLTNVKTRGTWGEIQLGSLLEQVLSPDQFAANVATKDSSERVEFAIRLPGQGIDNDETVWLPIDAKFPLEDYQRLVEAQERSDVEAADTAGRQLEAAVRACARDLCKKHLNPPRTTDFGILFLPIEGLFAEVIRRTGLTEVIQRECRVVIAGPTTLWAILNSLQMGFRTLAIQKRSSEVWNLLGAVKTEWTKYGDILDAVQKKLHQAAETIEKAKVRSRAVGRKLRDVEGLPVGEMTALLPSDAGEDDCVANNNEGQENGVILGQPTLA